MGLQKGNQFRWASLLAFVKALFYLVFRNEHTDGDGRSVVIKKPDISRPKRHTIGFALGNTSFAPFNRNW